MITLRTILVLCGLILNAMIATGCSSTDATPKPPDFKGLSGKVNPEAETDYSKARVLWSRHPGKTSAMETCSDPKKAIALLDAAIAREPKYAEAYIRRGLAKSEMGMRDAFDDATIAVRLAPSPENYAYRGLISLRGKNLVAAKRDLEYSLSLNDSQYLAWSFSGALELIAGNAEAACANFDRACSNGDCTSKENASKEGLCK